MLSEKIKDGQLDIINHYGLEHQLKYIQSEMYEMVEAMLFLQYKNFTKVNDFTAAQEHVAEEISDMYVMLGQFKEYYGITDDKVKSIMLQKIIRQKNRIENEFYSEN